MRDFEKMKNDSALLNKEQEKSKDSRRIFLKKAAYSAPALIVMGQLMKLSNATAGFSDPAPPPGSGKSTSWNP